MDNCIFCRIVSKQANANIVYQDELASAFSDIHPVAPIHVLIVPNKHISSINETNDDDALILGHLLIIAKKVASQVGIDQSGYRLIINTGKHGGQEVFHLHVHLIGGQRMRHPLG